MEMRFRQAQQIGEVFKTYEKGGPRFYLVIKHREELACLEGGQHVYQVGPVSEQTYQEYQARVGKGGQK